MTSIVSIIRSLDIMGSGKYNISKAESGLFLFFTNDLIALQFIKEVPCDASISNLAAKKTLSAQMTYKTVAEQIHSIYDSSTNIESIFENIFPNFSGEFILHKGFINKKDSIYAQQKYVFKPVSKPLQEEIKKDYSLLVEKELLVF